MKLVGDEHLGKFCYCNQHLSPHATGWCTVDLRNKIALKAETIEEAGIECMNNGFQLFQRERVSILPRDLKANIHSLDTFIERRGPADGTHRTFVKVKAVEKVRDVNRTRFLVTHEEAFGVTSSLLSPQTRVFVYRAWKPL